MPMWKPKGLDGVFEETDPQALGIACLQMTMIF